MSEDDDDFYDRGDCYDDYGCDDDVDCAGYFLERSGEWVCGWVGTEMCDWECPYSDWMGKTLKEIQKEEDAP